MKTKAVQTLRVKVGAAQEIDDYLSVEEALQICINGEPYSITMRTPGDDEKLVRGLLFSEAVVGDPAAEIRCLQDPDRQGNEDLCRKDYADDRTQEKIPGDPPVDVRTHHGCPAAVGTQLDDPVYRKDHEWWKKRCHHGQQDHTTTDADRGRQRRGEETQSHQAACRDDGEVGREECIQVHVAFSLLYAHCWKESEDVLFVLVRRQGVEYLRQEVVWKTAESYRDRS